MEFIAQGTALNYFALAHVFDALSCGGRETLIVHNAMKWVYTIKKSELASFNEISE